MASELVIEGLALELQALCRRHIANSAALGIETLLPKDGGFRTPDEQRRLFGKGRDFVGGQWIVVEPQHVVTHALPEEAPHCYRGAYDLWVLYRGRLATMDPRDGWTGPEIADQLKLWGQHVLVGMDLGLVCGAHFSKLKDFPHFELRGWRALPMG